MPERSSADIGYLRRRRLQRRDAGCPKLRSNARNKQGDNKDCWGASGCGAEMCIALEA